MKTLAEVKKELNKFKSVTIKSIQVMEYDEYEDGEYGFICDVYCVVTDRYGNFDTEFIEVGEFTQKGQAMRHARMLATKLETTAKFATC